MHRGEGGWNDLLAHPPSAVAPARTLVNRRQIYNDFYVAGLFRGSPPVSKATTMLTNKLQRVVKRPEAAATFGYSRTKLWRKQRSGEFPPLDVPEGWYESSLVEHQQRLRDKHQQANAKK
jgi:predicted DNA-binding transcriptional regulator AlpA